MEQGNDGRQDQAEAIQIVLVEVGAVSQIDLSMGSKKMIAAAIDRPEFTLTLSSDNN